LDKVESIFQRRFLWAITLFVGAIPILYGALGFLQQKTTLTAGAIHGLATCFGIAVILGGWFLLFKKDKGAK
jgi:multisubunit Na+/H+ antiporter MnhG subunit